MASMSNCAEKVAMPTGAVYTRALGTVGAAMYMYTADQMRAYALANIAAERLRCAAIAEASTLRKRTLYARMNHAALAPCEIAAAIAAPQPAQAGLL
jgi:hypothetical protein